MAAEQVGTRQDGSAEEHGGRPSVLHDAQEPDGLSRPRRLPRRPWVLWVYSSEGGHHNATEIVTWD